MISVIIPVLNESKVITELLGQLQAFRKCGHQIIVVDGGSSDDTAAIARPSVDKLIISEPGRARQMNAGAEIADGDILWFLHADTNLPANADILIEQAVSGSEYFWGRFDVRLSGEAILLRVVERSMNMRSLMTGIATGDQGIFCLKQAFIHYGGYSDIPLMEDIDLCSKLKNIHRPVRIKTALMTSSRRWEEQGIIRTIGKMWWLRLAYYLGADPGRLARQYGYEA